MPNVLSIQHLSKHYGAKPVLNDITITVEEGEFFVVYGPSGVGKTTLLNLVAGLDQADSGEIWLDNRRIDFLNPDERNVSMTFQSYALYPHWTAFENIASPLRTKKAGLSKEEVTQRVHEVAKTLTIDHVLSHHPAELSGGQKQRVGLARSLVRACRVLLLDSPLAHVDAKVRHEMRGRLKQISQNLQCAIVYVTHDYLEALGLGDRIAVMMDGHILQVATPHLLYERPVNLWVARNVGQPEINVIPARLDDTTIALGEHTPIPLPETVRARFSRSGLRATSCYLAIRPEHITLGSQGGLQGRVQLCQWLGTRTIVTLVVAGLPNIVVAVWGLIDLAPDTQIDIAVQWEHALWFTLDSEQNIFATEGSNDASAAIPSK